MIAERPQRYPKSTYKLTYADGPNGQRSYFLLNLATNERRRFPSEWKLLQAIERDLNQIGFPQNTLKFRSWGEKTKVQRKNTEDEQMPAIALVPQANNPTFIVKVLYRQNATWQGTIQWVEGRQTLSFRSEYEMLKLMDEASQLNAHEPLQSWKREEKE